MENEMTLLNEIKNITGFQDFSKLSQKQYLKIIKLISEHKLKEKHLEVLISNYSNFITGMLEAFKTIQDVVKGVESSHKEALKTFSDLINQAMHALEKLAEKAESDETRIKIAKKIIYLSEKSGEILKKMNEDNNGPYKTIVKCLLIILAILGGVSVATRRNNY
jgi:hypothetical protein